MERNPWRRQGKAMAIAVDIGAMPVVMGMAVVVKNCRRKKNCIASIHFQIEHPMQLSVVPS
jgi:hypothetical protein